MVSTIRRSLSLALVWAFAGVGFVGLQAQEAAEDADRGLPLEAERWARFTTSEGTWISLDLSPDGQTVVFDMLGDLYTMPITGGTATRLTSGMAHDMQPRFSPDGETVVFVSDGSGDDNVWMVPAAGGEPTQLSKGIGSSFLSPEWTPDGNYVVVSRAVPLRGLEKLWLYHKDGGTGLEMVGGAPGLRMLGAAMGPDPRYVYYHQRVGSWQYNAIFPQYQLRVFDRETGTQTTLTNRYGSAFRAQVSPDGRWLTYGSRHDADTGLRIRDLESGEERWLVFPIQRDEQESVANMDVLPGYSFTPESDAVVMSYGGGIWRVPLDDSGPTEIPFTVEAEVAVGPEVEFEYPIEDTPTFVAKQIRDAVPSPDGTRLAFTSLDRLYVQDLPDGTPRRLTNQNVGEFHPVWSPDGSAVAFVTWDDVAGEGHIMRVPAGGGNATRVTQTSAYYQQPAWSPDGARIVAIRASDRDLEESIGPVGAGLGSEFVWVPAGGGEPTVIGPTGGRSRPHFAGDSERIFSYGFAPNAGPTPPGQPAGTVALVSTRWDNTDMKRHLRVTWRLPIDAGGYKNDPSSDIILPQEFNEDGSYLEPQGVLDGDEFREASIPELSANLVMMAPTGDRALVLANRDLFVVTVPVTGSTVPTVMVSKPDSAAMPVVKLTDIGGEFPAWSADGQTAHWSIGNAFASYDLSSAGDPGYRASEQRIEVSVDRDIPEGTVILRGATVVTMRGDEVIENADVVVTNNRIARVTAGPDPQAGGRRGHRCLRNDHRARVRRYPCPHVEPVGSPLASSLDLPGQPGLRGDDHSRSSDCDHRRVDLRRPGGCR